MADARIDQNNRNVLTAYNETTGQIEPVRIDAVLDAVLVFGVADTGGIFTTLNNAKIDGNSRNTLSTWNEKGRIETSRCSNNGELLVISV